MPSALQSPIHLVTTLAPVQLWLLLCAISSASLQSVSLCVWMYSLHPCVCGCTVCIHVCVDVQCVSLCVWMYSVYPCVCGCTVCIPVCVDVQSVSLCVWI